MGTPFLILLAVIWALFGLWCYQRGTKFALLLLGLIAGVLFALSVAPNLITKGFRYVNAAAKLFSGSEEDLVGGKPVDQIMILLVGALALAAVLSLLKAFRGRHSIVAFFLGLLSGYTVTSYTTARLLPNLAFLPLPIKIEGLAPIQLSAAINTPAGQGLLAQANGWLANTAQLGCSSEAIILVIVGFILLVIFAGGRGGKKG